MQGKIVSHPEAPTPVYVGIDVCKDFLDVYLHPVGQSHRLANSPAGLKRLKKILGGFDVRLVTMEATAKYHRLAWRSLHAVGIPVAVCHPLRTRLFAQAIGQLAKSDTVDPKMLAVFGESLTPAVRPPPTEVMVILQELVRSRADWTNDLTALKNQRGAAVTSFMKAELQRRITSLEKAIARVAEEIDRHIASDPFLERRYQILRSIPGIGPGGAAVLLADIPELGELTSKSVAALTGLAPYACESGDNAAPRHIKGGRHRPRKALYMSALAAIRANQALKALYERLRGKGKKAKVALTAVMRKLAVLANTLVKEDRHWTTNPP